MAIVNEYPYTDFHEMNLDWILKKIKEFEVRIDSVEEGILSRANAYTDEQIAIRLSGVESEFTQFKREVEGLIAGLDSKYDRFVQTVNARMTITEARLAEINDRLGAILGEANQYTQYAIAQNNEYIIDQTTKALDTVTVLNYFTGARVSIQAMFDYLAKFHLENAITVQQLVTRQKTVQQLIDYNMTMTDLATNGGSIIQ